MSWLFVCFTLQPFCECDFVTAEDLMLLREHYARLGVSTLACVCPGGREIVWQMR